VSEWSNTNTWLPYTPLSRPHVPPCRPHSPLWEPKPSLITTPSSLMAIQYTHGGPAPLLVGQHYSFGTPCLSLVAIHSSLGLNPFQVALHLTLVPDVPTLLTYGYAALTGGPSSLRFASHCSFGAPSLSFVTPTSRWGPIPLPDGFTLIIYPVDHNWQTFLIQNMIQIFRIMAAILKFSTGMGDGYLFFITIRQSTWKHRKRPQDHVSMCSTCNVLVTCKI
jgi:hypothetical protein